MGTVFGAQDPLTRAHLDTARALLAMDTGRAAEYVELFTSAAAGFERAGDIRHALSATGNAAFGLIVLGAFAEAEQALEEMLGSVERLGMSYGVAATKQNLAWARTHLGKLDDARRLGIESAEAMRQAKDLRMEGCSRTYLAVTLVEEGELAAAEEQARAGVELLAAVRPLRAFALAILARALLRANRRAEALVAARDAMALVDPRADSGEEGEAHVRLVFAESLEASGDHEAACAAISAARDRLLARAAVVGDARWQKSFLENRPEHARTLALAGAWLAP
jgi:tetratricopeptide (TPR) repeat protein